MTEHASNDAHSIMTASGSVQHPIDTFSSLEYSNELHETIPAHELSNDPST